MPTPFLKPTEPFRKALSGMLDAFCKRDLSVPYRLRGYLYSRGPKKETVLVLLPAARPGRLARRAAADLNLLAEATRFWARFL